MSAALPSNSVAPTPNTWARMLHNRRKLSSRPMEKSNNMTPSSANGSIAWGREMVR